MKRIYSIFLFLLISGSAALAQHTVGLLSYNPSKAYDGYNLIYPHNQPNVYLLNNCGEVVHVWTDDANMRPGNTAYLLPDGRLVKTKRPAAVANDPIWAGGGGATIEIRTWDNVLEWSYTVNDSLDRFHHDFTMTPSGNIMLITWEYKSRDEAIAAGRDTALVGSEFWPDYIMEINPATDEIVWEWHVWDHLIQDFDSTKANYGVVADHPELININHGSAGVNPDWLHSNSLDFSFDNNMLLMSVPTFDEIWVIDHSTSTQEAAGHFGGNSGRGGDLIYRYGNPAAYDAGTATDQKLYYQHDAHWIDDFVDSFDPYYGKIGVFNNQVGADYSSANVLDHGFDMYSWSFPFANGVFGPDNFELTLTHPTPQEMYSTGLSSIQYLPNGNFLLHTGRTGYAFELTPQNEIVWEYKVPFLNGAPVEQGTMLTTNNNLTFRMDRYPSDFSAFDGKDLSSQGWLELNPDTNFCSQILPANSVFEQYQLRMYPNPANDMVTLTWEAGVYIDLEVFDWMGRRVVNPMRLTGGRKYLDTSTWQEGLYLIRINGKETGKLLVHRG
ncbi:MAG: aryl-sulfate sulfotransferase [Saprospiraceae bacterium]